MNWQQEGGVEKMENHNMMQPPPRPKKNDDVYQMISKFVQREKEEAEKEKKRNIPLKVMVSIDPDSVIGKEIKYQTVLLREILNEIRGR